MQLTNDGLTLWYGTPDTPINGDTMTIGVRPAHPANAVALQFRNDRGHAVCVRASSLDRQGIGGDQYFRAALPSWPEGASMDVRPIATCAGRQVPRPNDIANRPAGWFRLERTTIVSEAPSAGPPAPGALRFEAGLEFLGAVSVTLARPEEIGAVPQGLRRNFYITGGICVGPRLNATIRSVGGDWLLIQRDGVAVPSVRATWQTSDGAVLFSDYSGVFDLGNDGYERALVDQFPPTPPLHLAPRFVTSDSRYQWLARLQCVGIGQVDMKKLLVEYDLYAVRGGTVLSGGGAGTKPRG